MSRTVALVPVKSLAVSKSRLAPVLRNEERTALSARLLEHVLTALDEARSVDDCWVIGGDRAIEALARRHQAGWLPELGVNLNHTLACALDCLPEDVTTVLILPMDLPFLTGQAVDTLVARLVEEPADVVIAPDRWEQGTNALLLSRPFELHPAFGPQSLARHRDTAVSHGLRLALHYARELAFDVDTPADLAESGLMITEEHP